MSPRKRDFEELRAELRADPRARKSVESHRRAVREALSLADLRLGRQQTQSDLARTLGVTQANVSRVEHQGDVYISTLRDYVAALGGKLEIHAVFPDRTVTLKLPRR